MAKSKPDEPCVSELPGRKKDRIALAPAQLRDPFETLLGQEEQAWEKHGAGR